MQSTFKPKSLLAVSLALLIIACNNGKPEKTTVHEVNLVDITQEEDKLEPPPPPPPKPDLPPPIELNNCFSNDGLKFSTTIKVGFNGKQVAGYVESAETGSEKTNTAFFQGTKDGNELKVEFNPKSSAPIVGDASEWTNKPWTIKKVNGKEVLQIIFNAKNYDTNKWEDTVYEFELTDCK